MKRLVLASGSPRRKELLAEIIEKFEVIPGNYEEDMSMDLEPEKLAIYLSEGKARDVAKKVHDAVILAADTFVVLGKTLLGKPKNMKQAREMLKNQRGREQQIITGFTLFDSVTKKKLQQSVVSTILMKQVTDEVIEDYIHTHEVLDKAGGYAIQEAGDIFIEEYTGSYTNIVGLPLDEVKIALKEFGIETFK